MKCKYYIHTIVSMLANIMLAVCGVASVAGCSDNGGALADIPVTECETRMSLYISLGNTGGAATRRADGAVTRATPAGSYDDGRTTPYENYIGTGNYRVLLFDTVNKYITTLIPESLTPVESNETTSKLYVLTGRLTAPLPSSFKIMMLANWPQYPENLTAGVSTVDDVCKAAASRYTYSATTASPFILSEKNLIPMFGIKRCDNITFTPGFSSFVGTLHLLRAMAKVEVSCPEEWWTLKRVSVYRHAAGGNCAPKDVYDESGYVRNDYNLDYTDDIHVDGITAVGDTIDFVPLSDGRYIIYLPEYRNTVAGTDGVAADDAAEIWVEFEERVDKKYKIDFKDYNADGGKGEKGKEFDIRRNYYYRFTIDKLDEYMEPEISLDVFPYHVVELDPIFGRDDK